MSAIAVVEERLAELACAFLRTADAPRVLIGGLGFGFTLRAALKVLPRGARIEGPALIREPTTTVVAYPGSTVTVSALGNYLLEVQP